MWETYRKKNPSSCSVGRVARHNFEKRPLKDHLYQVCSNLAKWGQQSN